MCNFFKILLKFMLTSWYLMRAKRMRPTSHK